MTEKRFNTNFIDLVMQKDCQKCGNPIQTKYPYYRDDGSRFVVCDNCKEIMEL